MCTLIGRSDGASPPFLASTSDDPYWARTHVVRRRSGGGHRYVGTVLRSPGEPVPWDGMVTRAVNDAGLAFTYAYVEPVDAAPDGPDPAGFSERLIAECRDVDDAIALLAGGAPAGCTGNYLILDAAGRLAAVAVAGTVAHVERGGLLVRTNAWVGDRLERPAFEARPSPYAETAEWRRTRAERLVRRATCPEAAGSVLADHDGRRTPEAGYGRSICNHGSSEGTVGSEILVPATGTLLYAYGSPCGDSDVLRSWSPSGRVAFSLGDGTADGALTDVDGHIRHDPV